MLTNTVTSLLIIAIISLLRFRKKFDNILIPAIIFAISFIFYRFLLEWKNGSEYITTLIWDSSRSGDIKIDILSNSANYLLILPFFTITIIALINNLFFRFEDKKRNFSALLILNLLSFIMLIAGNNLIQIITFVFVIDILSQLFIKDIYASRRYSIYNLIADMGLFLIMAMLKGKLNTLDVGSIAHYYENGRHRDFIMFVLMISLFIKFGFFLFQSYMLDLKSTKFHRLVLIPCLSTPMVALILLLKFYPLLVVSPSFDICLNIVVCSTMIWGTIGMIVVNNLKEKTVYFNMLIISMLAKLLQSSDFVWNISMSIMLIQNFGFNLCLYYIHYFSGRKNSLSTITNVNKLAIKTLIVVYILISGTFFTELNSVINEANSRWIYTFFVLFILSWSHVFAQILSFDDNQEKNKFDFYPFLILCIYVFISSYLLIQTQNWDILTVFAVIFTIMLFVYPLKNIFENKKLNFRLQKIDFFAHIYDIIVVNPIKIMGRWLTVLFDFMFIEKTVTAMCSSLNSFTIRIFRKVSRHVVLYYLVNLLLAILVVLWCFLRGNK